MSPISDVSQSTPTLDSLALVNSFYGSGATACWYLTCFSCFLSWTLHPKKRIADAITNDLIATITFPCVESAHLITQVRNWSSGTRNNATGEQMRASLAASLIIIEMYLCLCVVLLLPGLFSRVPKRLSLLGATGVFCIAADLYLYVSFQEIGQAPRSFKRRFIIDSLINLILVIGLATTLIGLFLAYICVLCLRRAGSNQARLAEHEIGDDFGLANQHPQNRFITFLSFPFMMFSFFGTSTSLFLDILSMLAMYWEPKTDWTQKGSFIDEFFPRTDTSIKDLDQAVSLFVGMTVLGCNLYTAANAQYKLWLREDRERRQTAVRQMAALRERRNNEWGN